MTPPAPRVVRGNGGRVAFSGVCRKGARALRVLHKDASSSSRVVPAERALASSGSAETEPGRIYLSPPSVAPASGSNT